MNTLLFTLIAIPITEIYLFIIIGSKIGALSTILLIFVTAIVGIFYARYEGLNTIRSGFNQLIKNEVPAYEMISGALIALGAILLIIPGFATDILGFITIFPLSRKIILSNFKKKFSQTKNKKNDFIEGEFEDIEDENDKKL